MCRAAGDRKQRWLSRCWRHRWVRSAASASSADSRALGKAPASSTSTVDVRRVRAVTDPLRGDDREAIRHLDQLRGVLAAKMLELGPGLIQWLDLVTGLLQA